MTDRLPLIHANDLGTGVPDDAPNPHKSFSAVQPSGLLLINPFFRRIRGSDSFECLFQDRFVLGEDCTSVAQLLCESGMIIHYRWQQFQSARLNLRDRELNDIEICVIRFVVDTGDLANRAGLSVAHCYILQLMCYPSAVMSRARRRTSAHG
jgi:hypothetical protein